MSLPSPALPCLQPDNSDTGWVTSEGAGAFQLRVGQPPGSTEPLVRGAGAGAGCGATSSVKGPACRPGGQCAVERVGMPASLSCGSCNLHWSCRHWGVPQLATSSRQKSMDVAAAWHTCPTQVQLEPGLAGGQPYRVDLYEARPNDPAVPAGKAFARLTCGDVGLLESCESAGGLAGHRVGDCEGAWGVEPGRGVAGFGELWLYA